ncbi:chymotrypsin-2-like [Uranotaenia lowii]|uniref:chymotrypsin-2-like n=1 Tax=Uranotaenia lowii TaxID=190385 RepID=UPI00247A569A|nr:chymotrypsin-2-like [Uranotaenia lowii]
MSHKLFWICFIIAADGIGRLHGSFIPHIGNHKVVGGHDAKPGEAPFQVSLLIDNKHQCAGSIINEHWILTAAHCIECKDESSMSILAGTNSLSSGDGRRYQVNRYVVHSMNNNPFRHNDIGLIRLKESLEFGELVKPIEVYPDAIPEGSPVTLSGWGLTGNDEQEASDWLQILDLAVFSFDECFKFHDDIFDGHMCTFTQYGEGSCMGDSGGPLTFEGKLAGIVSYGIPCARGYPDVFTRVSFYQDWIKETISEGQ